MTSIKVYPGDIGGVGHYRLIYPAQALQAAGHDIQIATPGEDDLRFAKLQRPDGTADVIAIDPDGFPDVDAIVIQRPIADTTWQFIRLFQQQGIKVSVDMDDNFDALHPSNPAAVKIRSTPRMSVKNVHRAITQADALIVSTPELARVYGKHAQRVTILENRVPAWWLDIPKPESDTIGWSGTARYHVGDVEQLGATLGILQDEGRHIHIVGPEPEQVRFGLRKPATFTEWRPIEQYGALMAAVGVGVVPLQSSPFNRCKSWLKGIEFAAVGVPVVASPLPEYQRLYGVGLVAGLAEKPKDWLRHLRDLAPSDGSHLRGRIRQLGFTYEDRVGEWWQAWTAPLHP